MIRPPRRVRISRGTSPPTRPAPTPRGPGRALPKTRRSVTMAYQPSTTTAVKSPMYGGFRGPTAAQPPRILNTTRTKSPQHWGDVGGPPLAQATSSPTQEKAVPGEEEEELKQ